MNDSNDETRLARRIHVLVADYLDANPSRRVRKVVVRTGLFDRIDLQQLNRSWRQAATGPVYHDSYIELHREEPQARCTHCNHVFELAETTRTCPRCHNEQFTILHESPTIEDIVTE